MTDEKSHYPNTRGIAALCTVLCILCGAVAAALIIASFTGRGLLLPPGVSLLLAAFGFLVSAEVLKMLADIADNSHLQVERAEESVRLLRKIAAPAGSNLARVNADAEENAAMEMLVNNDPVVTAVQQEIVAMEVASVSRCKTCKGELPKSKDGQRHKIKCPTCGNWATI